MPFLVELLNHLIQLLAFQGSAVVFVVFGVDVVCKLHQFLHLFLAQCAGYVVYS